MKYTLRKEKENEKKFSFNMKGKNVLKRMRADIASRKFYIKLLYIPNINNIYLT